MTITEKVNAIVTALCAEEGVEFRTLSDDDVVKFALAGVKQRIHNYAYQKERNKRIRGLNSENELMKKQLEEMNKMIEQLRSGK